LEDPVVPSAKKIEINDLQQAVAHRFSGGFPGVPQ
jgi:hypothetical protein